MLDLKACTVCLSTNGSLCNIDVGNLREEYNSVSGLKTCQGNGLPAYLCFECTAYVRRCKKFREKCQRGHYTLQQIRKKNKEITLSAVMSINRSKIDIMPSLSYLDYSRIHCQEIMFHWTKFNRPSVKSGEIPVFHYNVPYKDIESDESVRKKLCDLIKFEDSNFDTDTTFDDVDLNNDNDLNKSEEAPQNLAGDSDSYFDSLGLNVPIDNNNPIAEHNTDNKMPDGSNLEEQYASMIPISMKEAVAAVEVYKLFSTGKFKCTVCNKGYQTERKLNIHMRMHDMHVSGLFCCELCKYYYKTEFLLKTHMKEKHLYKYLCKKCNEVNFDRTSAKQHFIWAHLQKGYKKNCNWYEKLTRLSNSQNNKCTKSVGTLLPLKMTKKLPHDFPKFTVVSPQGQYEMVRLRQTSKNYIESEYKCNKCYRGFREIDTYNKHLRKHDEAFAGPLECDMCKIRARSTRAMYKHMIVAHLFQYACQMCNYTCFSKGQANQHYRWHKNVTYDCPQCDKVFTKHSTRLTHIRIKHPSTALCNLCGHSFVSEAGLYFHKRKAHSREEIIASDKAVLDSESTLYCIECNVQFLNDAAFKTHLGSSNKHASVNLSIHNNNPKRSERVRKATSKEKSTRLKRSSTEIINNGVATGTNCEVCGVPLPNDVQARKHYQVEHPGTEFLKRYMCDICGHTTKQYANLLVHMRTHTREKPYACPHCDRKFSMPSNRDRHLVVHTGEKRYECEHCHRRFTQSSAVKLHIQTVHLKIPYAPWDKKNRKRRKEMESAVPQPEPKLLVDSSGQYINAYITYSDDV